MKPGTAIIGAFTIAALSGTAGFFIGKNRPSPIAEDRFPPALEKKSTQSVHRSTLDKADLKSLRAELENEKDPLARFKLATRNMEAWMNADPQSALAWLMSQQQSDRRNEILRAALGQFTENDPQAAAAWILANLTGVDQHNSLLMAAESWALRDGSGAAAWFSALPPSGERDSAMETLFFSWATQEPSAALGFIGKNSYPPELSAILRTASHAGWAKSDPQGAVAASLDSGREHRDPAQFANTLANWATMDLASSSQWLLANLKSGTERDLAVKELSKIFASQSPDAGLAWIEKLDAGTERERAINQFAPAWARSDPSAAAKWAASQSASVLSDASVDAILENYLMKDADGFRSWRETLPAGVLRERAEKFIASSTGDP